MSKIPSEYLDEKAYLSFMKSAIKINKGEVKITSIMGINWKKIYKLSYIQLELLFCLIF